MRLKTSWLPIVALLTASAPALATHKGWVMQHAGGDCVFESHSRADNGWGKLLNFSTFTRTAICPLTIAGRLGSSGPNYFFGPNRWAEAEDAYTRVVINDASGSITCKPVARIRVSTALDGDLYFGASQSVSGVGSHFLQMTPNESWGGALEGVESARIRSFHFECSIPRNPRNPSGVFGYGVKFCQNAANCTDGHAEEHVDAPENVVRIQGNGSNCHTSQVGMIRDADGLRFTGNPALVGWASVVCPIQPPTEDSTISSRTLSQVRMYYSGPGSAGCEQNGTCPACSLFWMDRTTGDPNQTGLMTYNSGGYLELPGSQSVGAEAGAYFTCVLKDSNWRLRGYTAISTQTRVSGGQ